MSGMADVLLIAASAYSSLIMNACRSLVCSSVTITENSPYDTAEVVEHGGIPSMKFAYS